MSDQAGERWVTVATFAGSAEAHLAAAKLEAEGIPSVLLDEHVAELGWGAVGAGAEVKLQVPAGAASQANEILQTATPLADTGEPAEVAPVACPRCQSGRVRPASLPLGMLVITLLLLGLPLMFWKRRFHCEACGYTWRA